MRVSPLCFLFSVLVYLVATCSLKAFTNIISFGDSLSDTGNAFILSGGTIPADPPYYMGRFSNGPNWLDCFSAGLGHDATASFSGGDNYSFGGAQAGDGTHGAQIGLYLSSVSNMADMGALYTSWIGGNDINNNAGSAGSSVTIASALSAYQADLLSLASAGVKQMLIPNLPDIGQTPSQLGSASAADATALTNQWNTTLANTIIPTLELAGVVVYDPDIHTLFSMMTASPGTYGFTNSTDAGILDPAVIAGLADLNDFVFMDDLHPTESAHKLLAQAMLDSVPTPSTAILFLFSAIIFCFKRSKSLG